MVSVPAAGAATGVGRLVGSSGASTRGRYMRNMAPCPTVLSTVMWPPLCRTMPYTVASPSPVPLPRGFATVYGIVRQSGGHITVERSEEHTSELQSLAYLVCRLLLEKKKRNDKEET